MVHHCYDAPMDGSNDESMARETCQDDQWLDAGVYLPNAKKCARRPRLRWRVPDAHAAACNRFRLWSGAKPTGVCVEYWVAGDLLCVRDDVSQLFAGNFHLH